VLVVLLTLIAGTTTVIESGGFAQVSWIDAEGRKHDGCVIVSTTRVEVVGHQLWFSEGPWDTDFPAIVPAVAGLIVVLLFLVLGLTLASTFHRQCPRSAARDGYHRLSCSGVRRLM
jgi:hypothetical protein